MCIAETANGAATSHPTFRSDKLLRSYCIKRAIIEVDI
jgi:hypothetical protein